MHPVISTSREVINNTKELWLLCSCHCLYFILLCKRCCFTSSVNNLLAMRLISISFLH